ncbi:MAG: hypothetical protein M9894_35145 [Planctomycetes bacterium]|nr:hypothetical protein [Planctomycetota bacterium]
MDDDPPRPELFRIVVRSVVACLLTEVALVLALGWRPPAIGWAYVAGWGLGAGAALAVAEAALWRLGLAPALLAGAALSPLAPLGGAFEMAFVEGWDTRAATQEVLTRVQAATPTACGWFVAAALTLYGPFLVALRRRATPAGQAFAMLFGAACFAAAAVVVEAWTPPAELLWREAALLLLGPTLLLPPTRRLGDRLARLLRQRPRASRGPRRSPARRVAQVATLGAVALLATWPSRAGLAEARKALLRWRARLRCDVEDMLTCAQEEALGLRWARWPQIRWGALPMSGGPPASGVQPYAGFESLAMLGGRSPLDWRPAGADQVIMWVRLAALRGGPATVRRGVELLDRPGWGLFDRRSRVLEEEALGWARQLAASGDLDAMLLVGTRLAEEPLPCLGPFGPPVPGARPLKVVEDGREGLEWLRRARALGAPDATRRLLRAARLSRSVSVNEALARIDEAMALWASEPGRAPEELAALEQARACLQAWAAEGR